jgi:SAM-dependent methyltransferase
LWQIPAWQIHPEIVGRPRGSGAREHFAASGPYARGVARTRGPDAGFFDLWSHFYDAAIVQRVTYRPPQDAVLSELRRAHARAVLDMGCGTGLLTTRIRDELAPERIVGCDFSRGMLERAAERAPDLSWVRGNALRLPFADRRFDAVVSTEAFHWFPDPERALRELFRVLAPKGRLMIAFVNPPTEWLGAAAGLAARLLGEPARWPTRARLRQEMRTAGFRVDAQRAVFRLPAPLLLPCVLTLASRPG